MSEITKRDIQQTIWPYVIVAYIALFVLGFLDNLRGPLFEDIIIDFSLSDTRASLFFVIPSFLAFLTGLVTERVISFLGTIWTLRLGLLFMGGAYYVFSLVPYFNGILGFSALFGVGFGLVSVAQNVAISEAGAGHLRRQLFSGLHSMYALASLTSPLFVSGLMYAGTGWRGVFSYSLLIPSGALAVSFVLSRLARQLPNKMELNDEFSLHPPGLLHILFFSISMSIYLIGEVSLSSRLVLLVRREFDISAEKAPQYLAVFFLLLFLSRLFFGLIPMRRFSTYLLMQLSLLLSAGLYILGLKLSPWFLAACGLTLAPFFPAAMDYVSSRFGKATGQTMAYCMAFASFMVVAMHYILGALTDRYGIAKALWLGPSGLILVFVLLITEKRFFRHRT